MAQTCRVTVLVACVLSLLPRLSSAQGRAAIDVDPPAVAVEGTLDVLYEDHENGGRLVHFVTGDNGRRIPVRFRGVSPELPTGSRVRLRGSLADGTLSATEISSLSVPAAQTTGEKRVLVVLLNFSNNRSQPFTAQTVASVNDMVRSFYLENTYGAVTLGFQVAGWFTIAATDAGCDYYTWASQAESAAVQAGIDLTAFDRRVFAFPRASSCSWTGMGNVSGPRSWINGSYSLRTVAHEQGHNFGNYHSHALRCDASACTSVDYGDDRDVLGSAGVVGHMNAFQKERLGWLNYGGAPAVQTVSASGTYWIDNYELASGTAPKALKIWNPVKGNYYYIESRARVGFDGNVAAGVTLHTAGTSGDSSYQVDLAPAASTWDSTLDVGQLFEDSALGLNIQTVSADANGAVVSVVFGGMLCVPAPPALRVSAASAGRYTLAVTNGDGDGCASAPFTFSASVPAGWLASTSPASLTLAPGASGSATMTLTPEAGASGTYAVTAITTNGTSGATASQVISVTILNSLDVTTSATLTGNGGSRNAVITSMVAGGGAPVAGAAVTVVVTKPTGAKTTLSATSGADGTAAVKLQVKAKDPRGTYRVATTAVKGGVTGTSATEFVVP